MSSDKKNEATSDKEFAAAVIRLFEQEKELPPEYAEAVSWIIRFLDDLGQAQEDLERHISSCRALLECIDGVEPGVVRARMHAAGKVRGHLRDRRRALLGNDKS